MRLHGAPTLLLLVSCAFFPVSPATLPTADAGQPTPRVSEPVWLVSAEGDAKNALRFSPEDAAKIAFNTSNNNLAIKLFDGRLYLAFRTATHHHPKPPVWSPQYLKGSSATTRLYVVSAPVRGLAWQKLTEEIPKLTWRLELEVNEALRRDRFEPAARALFSGDPELRRAAEQSIEAMLGHDEAAPLLARAARSVTSASADAPARWLEKHRSLFLEFDLREPFFFVLNGKLHFYFQQVEGKPMAFNSLRTWHMELDGARFGKPDPVLAPKEHFWEIQARREGGREIAYLSSYSGAHYVVNHDERNNAVHFRKSTDGVHWVPVDDKPLVYRGGASEAAFVFAPGLDRLWMVLRLDDGDDHGWGALVGTAKLESLGTWELPARADPRRFDSPRLFAHGSAVYLIARQNICAGADGKWDLGKNCPFDRQFVGQDEKAAAQAREGIFGKIRRKLMSLKEVSTAHADENGVTLGANPGVSLQYEYTYYFDLPKRTMLYRLNRETGRFEEIVSLPSAGDTAFPSIEPLGDKMFLVANYSSSLSHPDWSWRDGQQSRSGIYLVTLTFP